MKQRTMFRGTFILVLMSLGLFEVCWCQPLSDSDQLPLESSAEKVLSVFNDVPPCIEYIIEMFEKLFKDVLADVSATEDKNNEEINRRAKIISDALDKIERFKKVPTGEFHEEKWRSIVGTTEILDQFEYRTTEKATAEDRIFEKYFEKHSDKFSIDPDKRLPVVMEKVERKFETFWTGLNVEEKNKFRAFNDWHQKFNEESNSLKKLNLIIDLFTDLE